MGITATVTTLLTATDVATGATFNATTFLSHGSSGRNTFQAVANGTGTLDATVVIEVSNDTTAWLTLGTITLSGTDGTSDGFAADAPWAFVRARCTVFTQSSGTDKTLSVYRSV